MEPGSCFHMSPAFWPRIRGDHFGLGFGLDHWVGDPWEKKNGLEMEPASVILRQEDTLQPFRPYSEERTQSSESKRTDFTYSSATRHLCASGSYSESSCVPLWWARRTHRVVVSGSRAKTSNHVSFTFSTLHSPHTATYTHSEEGPCHINSTNIYGMAPV